MPECKPHRRLERSCRLTKHHVGEKHAAHPDHGGKDMERYKDCHARRLSTSGLEEQSSQCRRESLGHRPSQRASWGVNAHPSF